MAFDTTMIPDDVLGVILVRAVASDDAREVACNVQSAMLACKRFRGVLLQRATRATLRNNQQVPPFRSCLALRELSLSGRCTHLPWDDEDPPPGQPHAMAHLTALTRIDITPLRFNIEFDILSLAALRRCSHLRRLHLWFQSTDAAVLRHLLPLTRLQDLAVDIRRPECSKPYSDPIHSALDAWSYSVLSRLVSLQRLDVSPSTANALPLPPSPLGSLTTLRALNTPNLHINDEVLGCLSNLTALEHLYATCHVLYDARMARVCQFSCLKHLQLNTRGVACLLTATGTSKLASLAGLEHLELLLVVFEEGALAKLSRLRPLQHLRLSHCRLPEQALREIGQLCSLQHLRLDFCDGLTWNSSSDLRALTRLTLMELDSFRIPDTAVTDASMRHLCGITTLRSFNFCCHQDSDACIAHITSLRALQTLQCQGWPFTDDAMQVLRSLSYLTLLKLVSDSSARCITGKGLQPLREIPRLQELHLNGCHIADFGTECKLTALRRLETSCTGISGEGLTALMSAAMVEEVVLGMRDLVLDETFSPLSCLTRLRKLGLPGATDAGLRCLTSLPSLSRLSVGARPPAPITDAGLACLSGITSLKTLTLSQCPHITDAAVMTFHGMPQLEVLRLWQCPGITSAGLARLADRVLVRQYMF